MSARVELLMLEREEWLALESDPDGFARRYQVTMGEHVVTLRNVAGATASFLARMGDDTRWGSFLAMDPLTRYLVGTCGYKGPPDPDGAVEIAYFTFPTYEKQGYATAMASHLTALAAAPPAVRVVRAHTLPERNASARILEKLGFEHLGEVTDPEDGLVWRWERAPGALSA